MRRPDVQADDLIGPRAQPPLGDLTRIELSHGASRGVARIGKGGLARLLAFLVDAREHGPGKIDLAADLEASRWRVLQAERDGADRPDTGGHLFPTLAVAPRGPTDEQAVLVGQRDAEPVDLELGDVVDRGVGGPQALPDPLVERAQLVDVVCVVEAEHRRPVGDGRKALDRLPADALGWRIGRQQVGVRLFECAQLAHERVELGIRDLRGVAIVVQRLVMADLIAEGGDSVGGSHAGA